MQGHTRPRIRWLTVALVVAACAKKEPVEPVDHSPDGEDPLEAEPTEFPELSTTPNEFDTEPSVPSPLPNPWWVVVDGNDGASVEDDGSLFFRAGLFLQTSEGFRQTYASPPSDNEWLGLLDGRLLGWNPHRGEPEVVDPVTGDPYPPLPAFVGVVDNWGITDGSLWVIDGSAQLKLVTWADDGWTCAVVGAVADPIQTSGPSYVVRKAGPWLFLIEDFEFRAFHEQAEGWVPVQHSIDGAMSVVTDGQVVIVGSDSVPGGYGSYGWELPPTMYRLPDLNEGVPVTSREVTAGTMNLENGRLSVIENDTSDGLLFDLDEVPGGQPIVIPALAPRDDGYNNWHDWTLLQRGDRLVGWGYDDAYNEQFIWFDVDDATDPPWMHGATPDQILTVDRPPDGVSGPTQNRWEHVVDCQASYE